MTNLLKLALPLAAKFIPRDIKPPDPEENQVIFNPQYMTLRFQPEPPPDLSHLSLPKRIIKKLLFTSRSWVTVGSHTYSDGNIRPFTIPDGFRTDLTSYPRWIGWLLLILLPFAYIFEHGFSLSSLYHSPTTILAFIGPLALLVMDPFGRHQRAALFHDYGYSVMHIPRLFADYMYRCIMDRDHVARWRQLLQFYAVRIFGTFHKR